MTDYEEYRRLNPSDDATYIDYLTRECRRLAAELHEAGRYEEIGWVYEAMGGGLAFVDGVKILADEHCVPVFRRVDGSET